MPSMSTTCPDRAAARRLASPRLRAASAGLTLVSVIFIIVVLAALGAALAKLSQRQQLGSAAEMEMARALQSARAGLEWGAFQLLRNPAPPAAAPACFGSTSFVAAGLAGFTVTVSCSRSTGSDGPDTMSFYELVANACNAPSGGACPAAGTPGNTYVERQVTWRLVR